MSNTSQASQRILSLLDENSFVEIGALVTARATDFNLKQTETPSDGVITGYGVIDGSLVYVYSQDASVLGGSIGEMHAKKICRLYDLALKVGAPVIGILDSAGLRLQESTDALNALGEIYRKQVEASGVIPQVTAVFGKAGGGLAVSSGLTDFTFMESSKAALFVNSPNAVDGNNKDKKDTSCSAFQAGEAGNADFTGTEEEIYAQIRALIGMLPSNNEDEAPAVDVTDDLNRVCDNLAAYAGDTAALLAQIADDNAFVEVKKDYAKSMVCGLMRLNGTTVGAVANRTAVLDENGKEAETFDAVLTPAGCEKAAEFIAFCDAFEIPVLSLTNVKGFASCECSEKKIAKAAAKLTYAFASATVPKVNVVIGQALGSAYAVMNAKATGADLTFAWPNALIGAMDGKHAAQIMFENESADVQSEKAAEYEKLQISAASAAARGYVDSIIEAADTRKYVIGAFEMLYAKREELPFKKHGTV